MKRMLLGSLVAALLAGCGSASMTGAPAISSETAMAAQGVKKLSSFDERSYVEAPSFSHIQNVALQINAGDKQYIGKKYKATGYFIMRDNPLVPFDTWTGTLFNPNKDIDYTGLGDLERKFLSRKSAEEYYEKLGASYMGKNGQRYLVTFFLTVQDRGKDMKKRGVVVDAIKHPDGSYVKP